jgi:Asp-tRNA(Asn)/Glu-tRNA(Gln) amidotransferase A subunit family amidase
MSYDLQSIKLPCLAGARLRLVERLVEQPAIREQLVAQLLHNGGIHTLRQLLIDEAPPFFPSMAPAHAPAISAAPALPDAPQAICRTAESFSFATIHDYAAAYREGTVTPEAVAQRVLDAIAASDAHDPPLWLLIACDRDDVLAQAAAATRRFRMGAPLSPLDGVPIAVKDELDQVPYGTTAGTRFMGRAPANEDATVVARLRAAGALLIGKTNMHEIGITPTGLNPHHGFVRNPYQPAHDSGGSSSGSAAIVAAGICPAAIGGDGGGSIRIPAAFCGVVGLMPTHGRVSGFGDAALDWTVAPIGPIAATARDAALIYALIAGPDPRDPGTQGQPAPTLKGFEQTDLRGLTLGIYRPWFGHASAAVVAACDALLAGLRDLGVQVREVSIPDLEAARLAQVVTILAEMATSMEQYLPAHRREFAYTTRVSLAMGRAFTARDYLQAQRVRTRMIAHFGRALEQVDGIVTPATGITAPAISPDALRSGALDASTVTDTMRFIFVSNLTGLPAIAFPAGYDEKGLPIGFQVIGRLWAEHVLLRIANAAELIVARRKPQLHYEILGQDDIVRSVLTESGMYT